jgi:hypothetical protein
MLNVIDSDKESIVVQRDLQQSINLVKAVVQEFVSIKSPQKLFSILTLSSQFTVTSLEFSPAVTIFSPYSTNKDHKRAISSSAHGSLSFNSSFSWQSDSL